jgi:glucose-1-phosphate cytidylyltransferase
MDYYHKFGHSEFIIALGYKSEIIKKYFDEVANLEPDLKWKISLVDTGLETATGGRIKRLENLLDDEFMMTYGDGLSNVNIDHLIEHHRKSQKLATLTAVKPPPRFGTIEISDGIVTRFSEKNSNDAGWINGGFFCLNKKVCDYILNDSMSFENETLNELVTSGLLGAFEHNGWWQPMDTLRDKRTLESIWKRNEAPWLQD